MTNQDGEAPEADRSADDAPSNMEAMRLAKALEFAGIAAFLLLLTVFALYYTGRGDAPLDRLLRLRAEDAIDIAFDLSVKGAVCLVMALSIYRSPFHLPWRLRWTVGTLIAMLVSTGLEIVFAMGD